MGSSPPTSWDTMEPPWSPPPRFFCAINGGRGCSGLQELEEEEASAPYTLFLDPPLGRRKPKDAPLASKPSSESDEAFFIFPVADSD